MNVAAGFCRRTGNVRHRRGTYEHCHLAQEPSPRCPRQYCEVKRTLPRGFRLHSMDFAKGPFSEVSPTKERSKWDKPFPITKKTLSNSTPPPFPQEPHTRVPLLLFENKFALTELRELKIQTALWGFGLVIPLTKPKYQFWILGSPMLSLLKSRFLQVGWLHKRAVKILRTPQLFVR